MLGGKETHRALVNDPTAMVPTVGGKQRRFKQADLLNSTERFLYHFHEFLLANDGERLIALLKDSKLRDLLVGWGILVDKFQLLSGQPTQIFGQHENQTLDQLEEKFLALAAQRQAQLAKKTEITVTTPSGS